MSLTFSGVRLSGDIVLKQAAPKVPNGSFNLSSNRYYQSTSGSAFSTDYTQFHIGFWLYCNSMCTNTTILSWTNNRGSVSFGFDGSGRLKVTLPGWSGVAPGVASSAFPLNQWHYLVCGNAGAGYIFMDGTQIVATNGGNDYQQYPPFTIGSDTGNFDGLIADVRVSQGYQWTPPALSGATTYVTVPTAPMSPITGTRLLLNMASQATFLNDSSSYGATNSSTNPPVWSSNSPYNV
jgi:hypothetical protein